MPDKREDILVALADALEAITGVVLFARNQFEIDENKRPAIQLFDGDEQRIDPQGDVRLRASGVRPSRVAMTPEIVISLGGNVSDIGTKLNEWRIKVVKAIVTDATLLDVIGPNGAIEYTGCSSETERARDMAGAVSVFVTFTYHFNPNQL